MSGPAYPTSYAPHRRISLKQHPAFTEKWVQERIAEDPSILGLGELEVKDLERRQAGAGRLDILLLDRESNTRYEVELQLGATDETHIIRTIEYWDLERRRYPSFDHVGVLIAEDVTARFFNVINLFNGFIPLIAIQMSAIEVGGATTLVFNTVMDRRTIGTEEDDGPDEPTDREYWLQRSSPASLQLVDDVIALAQVVEPGIAAKYNKHYIGLSRSGLAANYLSFHPRRKHIIVNVKLPKTAAETEAMEEEGLDLGSYNALYKQYALRISPGEIEEHSDFLQGLIRRAKHNYDGEEPPASSSPGTVADSPAADHTQLLAQPSD